jgi:hypothetical protein
VDLWSAIFTVIRRWYVALPILLVSILAMVVIGGKMQPDYKAEASLVFTGPARKIVNGQEQPFKNQYANDTKTLAAAVYRQITSADQHRSLEEDGFSPRYDLALDQFSAIMDIEVTAKSQEQAIDTANQLISETDRNALAIQRQSRPPEDELVRVDKIYLPVDAELVPGSKSRVMATVLLLGLVAAASAAFMVESLAARRRGLATDAGGAVRHPDGVRYPDPGYAVVPANGLAGAGESAPYAAPAAPPTSAAQTEPARLMPIEAEHTAGGGIRVDADELDALLAEVPIEPQTKVANGSTSNQPRTINRGRTGRGDESDTNGRSTGSVPGRRAGRSSSPAGEEHSSSPAGEEQPAGDRPDRAAPDQPRGDRVPSDRVPSDRTPSDRDRTPRGLTRRQREVGRSSRDGGAARGSERDRGATSNGASQSQKADAAADKGDIEEKATSDKAADETRRTSKAAGPKAASDKAANGTRRTSNATGIEAATDKPARDNAATDQPASDTPASDTPASDPAADETRRSSKTTGIEATDSATAETAETADTSETADTTATEAASAEEAAALDTAGPDEHEAEADQPVEPIAAAATRRGSSGAAASSDAPSRSLRATTTAHNAAGSKGRRARRSLWSPVAEGDRSDVTVSRPADSSAGDGD